MKRPGTAERLCRSVGKTSGSFRNLTNRTGILLYSFCIRFDSCKRILRIVYTRSIHSGTGKLIGQSGKNFRIVFRI